MKRGLMLFILLISGFLICGCTNHSQTQTVSNQQTQTLNVQIDPVVGVWTEDLTSSSDVSPFIVTYTFIENGDFYWDDSHSSSGPIEGQWTKIRENQYFVSYSLVDDSEKFIYNPTTDTLYQSEYPSLTIYRAGKMPSLTIKPATALIAEVPQSSNNYKQGDEIQRLKTDSAYDKDRAWVIIKVDNDEEKYTVGNLYYDPDARKWYKLNDDLPVIRFFSAVERDYPTLLGTINWDTVPIKYLVKNCDGDNILSYNSKPPECVSDTQTDKNTVSGYGDDVIKLDVKTADLLVLSISHNGRSNFAIILKDSEGNWVDLLVNTIGPYNGRNSVKVDVGTYYLDITADGPWAIKFST